MCFSPGCNCAPKPQEMPRDATLKCLLPPHLPLFLVWRYTTWTIPLIQCSQPPACMPEMAPFLLVCDLGQSATLDLIHPAHCPCTISKQWHPGYKMFHPDSVPYWLAAFSPGILVADGSQSGNAYIWKEHQTKKNNKKNSQNKCIDFVL